MEPSLRFSCVIPILLRIAEHILTQNSLRETLMKTWLKPQITESEAGMEVTSYLPAESDRA